MFEQAQLMEEKLILAKMAKFNISQDALDIVEVIGPRKFITLTETGEIVKVFWRQYLDWFETCPDSANDCLVGWYGRDECESDDKAWKNTCGRVIEVLSLVLLAETEAEWYAKAPKELKFIMDKALNNSDVLRKNPLVVNAIANYLAEAAEVAYYAELVSDLLSNGALTLE